MDKSFGRTVDRNAQKKKGPNQNSIVYYFKFCHCEDTRSLLGPKFNLLPDVYFGLLNWSPPPFFLLGKARIVNIFSIRSSREWGSQIRFVVERKPQWSCFGFAGFCVNRTFPDAQLLRDIWITSCTWTIKIFDLFVERLIEWKNLSPNLNKINKIRIETRSCLQSRRFFSIPFQWLCNAFLQSFPKRTMHFIMKSFSINPS